MFNEINLNILKKINNNDFNFTEDELFVLSKDGKTANYLIEIIMNNMSILNNSNIVTLILDDTIQDSVFNPLFETALFKRKKDLTEYLINLFRNPLTLSYINFYDYYNMEETELTKENEEEIRNLYTKLMKDPTFKVKNFRWASYYNDMNETVKFLEEFIIPNNRIDLLNIIFEKNSSHISSIDLISHIEDKFYNDRQNFNLIDAIILFLNGDEKFFDFIIDKINSLDSFDIEDSLTLWWEIISLLDTEQKEKLYKATIKKGVTEFLFIPGSQYFEFLKKNDLLEEFDSLYKSRNHITPMFIDSVDKSSALKSKEDITWLLEHGYFDYVLSFLIHDSNNLILNSLLTYIRKNKSEFKDYVLPIFINDKLINLLMKIRFGETSDTYDFVNLFKMAYNKTDPTEAFELLDYEIGYRNKKVTFNVKSLNELLSNNIQIADEFIKNYLEMIINNNEILKIYINLGDYYIETILYKVMLNEDYSFFYNHENYLVLKNYLSNKYEVPLENLDLMENAFGPLIIKYIENETIQEILKLSKEDLKKIIAIFPNTTYTENDALTLYDTVKQYEYTKVYSEEASLFTHFKEALQSRNEVRLNELILILSSALTTKLEGSLESNFVNRFPKYKGTNFDTYLRELCEEYKTNSIDALNKIRNIINDYLTFRREEYRKTYDFYNECNIREITPLDGNEKAICLGILWSIKNKNDKRFFKFGKVAFDLLDKRIKEEFAKLYKVTKLNATTEDILKFYVYGEKSGIDYKNISDIKKCIKLLSKIVKEIDDYTKEILIIRARLDSNAKVKIKHIIEPNEDVYHILTGLNINALRNNVLNNDGIYNSLISVMKKYKLHKIPLTFQEFLSSDTINMGDTLDNLGDFISYYYLSYMDEVNRLTMTGEKKDVTIPLIKILKDASVFSVASNIYSIVLTKEDERLIKSNPGPNEAIYKIKGNKRLDEAIDYTLECFKRDKVCVPTLNEIIDLGGKKLRVVVGNFTNPSTITHGERTGACMRIGGYAESLFDFVIKDPHGFHIRFEDAETHEYISRVTGFRNGNTVFLNELRYSLNSKFTNTDIFNACKKISDMLIVASASSGYAIENVLLTPQCVTEYYDSIPLTETNLNKGLGNFYTDYNGRAVIVSTTSKEKESIVPINFDNSHEVYYLPARDEVRVVKDLTEFTSIVNRINAIKRLQNQEELISIQVIYIDDFVYGIANNDFYIYINSKGEIIEDIITNDERALIELEDARKKVMSVAKTLGITVPNL